MASDNVESEAISVQHQTWRRAGILAVTVLSIGLATSAMAQSLSGSSGGNNGSDSSDTNRGSIVPRAIVGTTAAVTSATLKAPLNLSRITT